MPAKSTGEFFDEDFLARLERLHLISKRVSSRGAAGLRPSRRLGDGLEFADHRAYAPGDDVRFMDWPYYARMEKLLLRLFHEHSDEEVAVLLDTSASMAPGGATEAFDYARRAAAAVAYVAMGSLDRVTVLPFGEQLGAGLRTGRNRRQVLELLDFLSALEPAGRTRLGECVDRFARTGEGPAIVLLISDLLDCGEQLSDALARLRQRRCEVTVLHVQTPPPGEDDPRGPLVLAEAETGDQISLTVTEDVLESYRQQCLHFARGCERTCLSRGAVYVPAPTDVPFERLVLYTLRQAGVLAGS
jgi:uncharacterized protein (DUF58 family)